MVRIIIAGSRSFNDYDILVYHMNNIFDSFWIKDYMPIEIVCGMCRGADMLGERFAKENGYQVKYFPADWERYGKRAGVIRNEEMAKYAAEKNGEYDKGLLVAFWDGESRGTKNMISNAKKYGLSQYIVKFDDHYKLNNFRQV